MIDDRRIGARLAWLPLAALAVSWSAASTASEVFKWIDDDGVVHYSDTRPRHEDAVTRLELLETNPEDYDPAEDPYSVLNQARRVSASWRARDAADRQDDSRAQSAAQDYAPDYEQSYERDYGYGYPAETSYYYDRRPAYYPVVVAPPQSRRNPRAAPRQLEALETLGLGSRRPSSINSGVHRQRVLRSEALPIVTPGPAASAP